MSGDVSSERDAEKWSCGDRHYGEVYIKMAKLSRRNNDIAIFQLKISIYNSALWYIYMVHTAAYIYTEMLNLCRRPLSRLPHFRQA